MSFKQRYTKTWADRMETIGERQIRSFLPGNELPQATTNTELRKARGHRTENYIELAKKVAALQFANPQFVFLFRGQAKDYKNQQRNSSIKPSILRPAKGSSSLPAPSLLDSRFRFLASAERELTSVYRNDSEFEGGLKLARQRILRWSLLQHYEICFTPLLDVSQSLRVAASFATSAGAHEGFVYVLGVPNLSGALTASADAGLQTVRLSAVCPPVAIRPHIQEGYLLGEYPDMPDFDQKQHYPAFETDFGRRLIAKFVFDPNTFWRDPSFPLIGHSALYPNDHDPIFELAERLRHHLGTQQ